MISLAAALFLAVAEAPPPRTVNGEVLGSPSEFTTKGPSRVCMNDVMITALPRETVSLNYSGIHSGVLRLNRGTSWVDAAVGDIYVSPRELGDVIVRTSNYFVADASNSSQLRYGLFVPPDGFHHRHYLRVWIDGPALSGDEGDGSILRRIEIRNDQSPPCDVTYRFGWDVIFGEQPLAVRKKH
jgi:hypothetical protein